MIRIPISGARPQRPPQRWGREPGVWVCGPGADCNGRGRGHVELALGYHLVAAARLGRDQFVGGGAGRGGSQAPRRAGTRVPCVGSKAGDAPPAQDQGPGGVPERGFKVEAVMPMAVVCGVMPFEADIPAGDAQGEGFLRYRALAKGCRTRRGPGLRQLTPSR